MAPMVTEKNTGKRLEIAISIAIVVEARGGFAEIDPPDWKIEESESRSDPATLVVPDEKDEHRPEFDRESPNACSLCSRPKFSTIGA